MVSGCKSDPFPAVDPMTGSGIHNHCLKNKHLMTSGSKLHNVKALRGTF